MREHTSGPRAGNLLVDFMNCLRDSGVPVSTQEMLDASQAALSVGFSSRAALKAALRCAVVKNASHLPVFDRLFDLYFTGTAEDVLSAIKKAQKEQARALARGERSREGLSSQDLSVRIIEALLQPDEQQLRLLAQEAVVRLAGIEPGRPVVGTYYVYRVLRQLKEEQIREAVASHLRHEAQRAGFSYELSAQIEVESRMAMLRREVERAVRRILAADRGSKALTRSARVVVPEEVDIMHASYAEIFELKRALVPLAKKLGTRLARKHRSLKGRELNWRATIRASLDSGGTPVKLKFRKRRPLKPDLLVLADVSGSVASFSRFTLHLLYCLSSVFSKVRSFVFIDSIDEVTDFFEKEKDPEAAFRRINSEARVVGIDGHSDYGRVLKAFFTLAGSEVDRRTSLVIVGDARNNYHSTEAWVLKELAGSAKTILWLNPEPRQYWDTGDSVMSEYARFCSVVAECRTLRQLQEFVSAL